MELTDQKISEIKAELNSQLHGLLPDGIEGEIGVGKFRSTFHRIYIDGDGWMGGGQSIYAIVEVMGKLIKVKKDIGRYDKWFMSVDGGGYAPLSGEQKRIYKRQIHNAKVAAHHREQGTLEDSLR